MDGFVKQRAATTILQRGVKVASLRAPLQFILMGVKPRFDVVIHQPTIKELIEISSIIARMNVDSSQLQKIDLKDGYTMINSTAELMMEAMTIACRIKPRLISKKRVIKWLLKTIDANDFAMAWEVLVLHSGVADFINSTRLILQLDILNPQDQGSGQPDERSE